MTPEPPIFADNQQVAHLMSGVWRFRGIHLCDDLVHLVSKSFPPIVRIYQSLPPHEYFHDVSPWGPRRLGKPLVTG